MRGLVGGKAERRVEIAQGIAVDLGGFDRVAVHIAQHPAAHVGVVAGDDERAQHADPADPAPALVAELVEAADDVCLAGPAHGELGEHERHAEENDHAQIDQHKGPAAALVGPAGELPDVAETDGGACGREDEPQLAAPLCA